MRRQLFPALAPALALVLTLAVCAVGLTACGSGGRAGAAGGGELTVSAAASLRTAFTRYGRQLAGAHQGTVHFSFAGSDELAAQIEQGVGPDVFASANMTLPRLLYAKGLIEKPVVFASNRLVLAVPAGSSKVRSLADVARPGVTIAIGSATVPIGSYTRTVLSHLPPASEKAVLANVRDEEPDVTGIVGKLTEGAVDAGFLYATDVRATQGKLKAIRLPDGLQPQVAYGVAIVKGAQHGAQARAFIAGVLHGAGEADLRQAGFVPAPAG
jgi:molybdate transport system substrate-binding protein